LNPPRFFHSGPTVDIATGRREGEAQSQPTIMHYFWFIPLFAVMLVGIWVLYLMVARGLPKTSNRSVEDALAEDEPPAAPVVPKSKS
jgi:hypothetical protein